MKIAVWDTYVKRPDGKVMHFDILVSDEQKDIAKIQQFGQQYLDSKAVKGIDLRSSRCNFCHVEQASPEVSSKINTQGYAIIELENCD